MDGRAFWAALGLDELAERLYLRMMSLQGVGAQRYADELGCSQEQADEALHQLGALGLVRVSGGSYQPVEPRMAIAGAARARQTALDRAGQVADRLVSTYVATRLNDAPDLLFEVLRADEIGQRLAEMIRSATRSVGATAAPPYSPSTNPEVEAAEAESLARGVDFRAVYDSAVLSDPDQAGAVLTALGRGEQARTWPGLRVKMIVVDGLQVLMPLAGAAVDGAFHAVVISQSSLVNALHDFFELLWTHGAPIEMGVQRQTQGAVKLSDRRLLQLLAAGLSDQALVRQLNISERTLRRRVSVLQTQLGAVNRFQLGLAAVRRGLV